MTAMTMDRRAVLAASFSALLMPQIARAATAGDYKNLQAFINSYVEPKRLSGISIAILRGNDPVQYLNGGTLAFDTTAKCTPDSIWRIYSMTKPVAGIAVMRLIEDGKLTLDQPLSSILPEFTNMRVRVQGSTDTRPAAGPITIRHLLTHSSGLGYALPGANSPTAQAYNKNGITPGARTVGLQPGADLPSARTLEELCERLAKLPLDFDPGTRWQYAVGIDVLGLVVKKVSGKPSFYDYLKTTIFDPLKMHDTDFVVPAAKASRLTSVVAAERTPGAPPNARPRLVVVEDRKTSAYLRDRDIQSGGGGLASTARDYARFCGMLLNNGTLDGARVLKPETVAIARSNLLLNNVRASIGGRNGFGAAMQVVMPDSAAPGREPAGSYGWFGIAGTQMFIDPNNKYSVVTMLQMNPTTEPVQNEYKVAAYKDLAAISA
jgi:CubicO group peptidase (beta-lactamase class C family)